tara:strand:- start:945 stop:1124 length:180 start_codon:yes stop_codon:yes gene_type:complete
MKNQQQQQYPQHYIKFLERHYEKCSKQTIKIMEKNGTIGDDTIYAKLIKSLLYIELMNE